MWLQPCLSHRTPPVLPGKDTSFIFTTLSQDYFALRTQHDDFQLHFRRILIKIKFKHSKRDRNSSFVNETFETLKNK